MPMSKSYLLVAVAVLCIVAFSFVTGCDTFNGVNIGGGDDGGDGGDDGGGDADVALGTMRALQPGDTWTYRLTGTFQAAGGGTSQITPSTVTLVHSADTVTLGAVSGLRTLTFTIPVSWQGGGWTEVATIALAQTDDGTLRLHGISPAEGTPIGAVQDAPGYVAGPAEGDFSPLRGWGANVTMDQYGAFNISTDNDGVENVAIGGTSYAAHRVTGTKDLGGFGTNFTVWLNPQVGSFVKLLNNYSDVQGNTNLVFELQSTSFTP